MSSSNSSGEMDHLLLDPATISDWLKLPAWRAREAAALLSGIDPDAAKNIEQSHTDRWKKYNAIKRLFQRSIIMEFIDDYDTPQEWISLALRFDVEVDSIIGVELVNYRKPINYRQKYRSQKRKYNRVLDMISTPKSKRKNSYLRLIYAALEKNYPGWKSLDVTTSVFSDAELAGCALDRKTVKSILDEVRKDVVV